MYASDYIEFSRLDAHGAELLMDVAHPESYPVNGKRKLRRSYLMTMCSASATDGIG
jgi:hypothetical protein